MTTYSLKEKQLERAKKKVHNEMVGYFVNLDNEQKLYQFISMTRGHCRDNFFSLPQVEEFVYRLTGLYTITRNHLHAGLAADTLACRREEVDDKKVIRLNKATMDSDMFDDHMGLLDELYFSRTLQFREAVELVVIILDNYPSAIKWVPAKVKRSSMSA